MTEQYDPNKHIMMTQQEYDLQSHLWDKLKANVVEMQDTMELIGIPQDRAMAVIIEALIDIVASVMAAQPSATPGWAARYMAKYFLSAREARQQVADSLPARGPTPTLQ